MASTRVQALLLALLALLATAAAAAVGVSGQGTCESVDVAGMAEEDACRACVLPDPALGVTGSCQLCVERRTGTFFGCVSVSNNTVCQGPDDDIQRSCRDRCDVSNTKNCNNCLEARGGQVPGSCGWCESRSLCITGTKEDGPWDPTLCPTGEWRAAFRNETENEPYVNYQCTQPEDRVACSAHSSCSACTNSAELGSDGQDKCVWCSTPEGSDQETGSCSAESANAACAGTAIDYTDGRDACPFNSAAQHVAAASAILLALLALLA